MPPHVNAAGVSAIGGSTNSDRTTQELRRSAFVYFISYLLLLIINNTGNFSSLDFFSCSLNFFHPLFSFTLAFLYISSSFLFDFLCFPPTETRSPGCGGASTFFSH